MKLALCLLVVLQAQAETPAAYKERMVKWRLGQEAGLKADEGWLSVAGLVWLQKGESGIGSAENALVRLPASCSAKVGTLNFAGGAVTFTPALDVKATLNGQLINGTTALKPDADRVQLGAVTFMVIKRGERTGVRIFDRNAKGRREFKGMQWFPVDPAYRILATFVPYNPPRPIAITNVLGDTRMATSPGYVEFTFQGKKCRLTAEPAGDGLFFNFQDKTTGGATYPAGRFLDAPGVKDGHVLLDFNQAVNPPCAFTSFATCPLPPEGNKLPVAINAGEKTHHAAE